MRATFDNRPAQIAFVCFASVIVLIGVAGLSQSGDRAQGLVWTLVGVFSGIRGWRSSNVVVTTDTVQCRSVVRTKRLAVADLAKVEVLVGQTGMNGFGREYLVFQFREGGKYAFKELNAKPSNTDPTVVRLAARHIENMIQRTTPGSA